MSSVIKNEYLDSHLQAKRRHTGVGALFYSQLSSNFIYHPALWKNNVKKRKMSSVCLERMGSCISATRHQLTHWLSVDLNEPRLLLWLRWGKSGPNCPSLRLPLLHTHTHRMWWTCMHRHADTQVTLMYNTRTSISDSVGGTPSSHSKVYVMNTHGPVYLQSVSDDTKEIKAETHFFFSDEVLSLSIPVKTWNAAVVVSSWFDLVSSDLLCFAAHPWLLSHSSSNLPACLPASIGSFTKDENA